MVCAAATAVGCVVYSGSAPLPGHMNPGDGPAVVLADLHE
jgi:hypothetical protein